MTKFRYIRNHTFPTRQSFNKSSGEKLQIEASVNVLKNTMLLVNLLTEASVFPCEY